MSSIKDEFVGKKRNFNVIKMQGTTIKRNLFLVHATNLYTGVEV